MKFTSIIVLITFSLCAGMCCSEPEPYYNINSYSIENDTLINIENNVISINLGETVYIETNINNEQTLENGLNINVNDFENENYGLGFSLALYKLNIYGNIEKVLLNQDAITPIIAETTVNNENYNAVISVQTEFDNGFYMNKFGITLLETGTYYIGAHYNSDNRIRIYSENNVGTLIINSSIVNSNDENLYMFTVN